LLDCPIWSHEEYAEELWTAIGAVLGGRRVPRAEKLRGQRARRTAVLLDKARRAPSTVVIRGRGALARRRSD